MGDKNRTPSSGLFNESRLHLYQRECLLGCAAVVGIDWPMAALSQLIEIVAHQ